MFNHRLSKWYEQAHGTILSTTKKARCKEKVTQDFVFATIRLVQDKVATYTTERQYEFVDMLGIFGKFIFT